MRLDGTASEALLLVKMFQTAQDFKVDLLLHVFVSCLRRTCISDRCSELSVLKVRNSKYNLLTIDTLGKKNYIWDLHMCA